jgi:hypothetical protein
MFLVADLITMKGDRRGHDARIIAGLRGLRPRQGAKVVGLWAHQLVSKPGPLSGQHGCTQSPSDFAAGRAIPCAGAVGGTQVSGQDLRRPGLDAALGDRGQGPTVRSAALHAMNAVASRNDNAGKRNQITWLSRDAVHAAAC